MTRKTKNTIVRFPRGLTMFILGFFILGILFIAFVFIFDGAYKGRVMPGVRIGDLNLSGKSYDEAQALLQEQADLLINDGLQLQYGTEQFRLPSTIEDQANPELAYHIFSYDVPLTIQHLRLSISKLSEVEKLYYWIAGIQVPAQFQLDEAKVIEVLRAELGTYEDPAVDARLVIPEDGMPAIESERYGNAFRYDEITDTIRTQLALVASTTIHVVLEQDTPKITKGQAEGLLPLVAQILSQSPYTLKYEDKEWQITADQLASWLEFQVTSPVTVGLNKEKLSGYLQEIAQQINVEKKEAKFEMKDGKVAEFQLAAPGLILQIDKTLQEINTKIKQVGIKDIDLMVERDEPEVKTGDVNDLGIRELIGEGKTNFKGSPPNRRHNIRVGADKLNGILIKPGEEFSLLKALGKIEASTGYLPELVIKGNRTIPEFGGGLCQIGTTTFRVTLNAGLPITARTNHSYRVSYYEPPVGMDATIYDPAPDFRFVNDTGHYILFQTEIQGDNLIFRYYGTKDGRTFETTTPRVYNSVRPGPTKFIETTDLKPGEKKCIEKAHVGSDAEFTYTVTYPDGKKNVQVFRSHYKPWQEVCLVGVEKLSEEQ